MKKILILILGLLLVGLFIYKETYSVSENDFFNFEIYNNKDIDILKKDMLKFIDLVDNSIIVNSSFNFSSKLNENYDFLTKFAISFILDNEEEFDIIYGVNYKYTDEYGIEYISNKYIDIDSLYNITNKILGVEYYYIMDEKLVVDDKVILIDFDNREFDMVIDKISNIDSGNGFYDVYVRYLDNEIDYIYRFEIVDNNRLIISNLSVLE